jgi:hypothetical protein
MSTMLGKSLIVVGLILALLGALILIGGRVPWLGRLPGDIRIERPNFTFYAPVATCILISVVATLLFWIISKIFRG